jgi:Uma2 family endonuclease
VSLTDSLGPSNVAGFHPTIGGHRFTRDQYHRMIETGVLTEDDKVELLEGWITDMMTPLGTDHSTSVCLTQIALQPLVPSGWYLAVEQSISHDDSEPEPDLTIVKGHPRDRKRTGSHPHGGSIGLIVEVADSSLDRDRSAKHRIYAAAGIPEYWIVNLIDRKLEVHRRPVAASGDLPARYETVDVLDPGASVDVVLDGVKIGSVVVRDVLP